MTLEDAFEGCLTSNVKGLQKFITELTTRANGIKEATEKGDLATLKKRLAVFRGLLGGNKGLNKLIEWSENRVTQLTVDENGNIVDLSVPPTQRR